MTHQQAADLIAALHTIAFEISIVAVVLALGILVRVINHFSK